LPRLLEGVPALEWIGRAFAGWFAFQCHRDPERTLSVAGQLLPVCMRCLGIYVGLGLGALVMRPKLDTWPLRIWVGIASVFMILDVITELFALRPAWAPLRLFTGLFLAYPVGAALVRAVREGDG
jgi:uncharacterized membrane protein